MSRWRLLALAVAAAVLLVLAVVTMVSPATAQAPVAPACVRVLAAGDSGVFVNLSNEASPASIAHVRDAVAAGQPRLLHWAPDLADAHRKASLRGKPTAPGMDRDEYPPASSAEGGAGADVRLIPRADNRSSGQRLGAVMHAFCDGQAFIVEP